MIEWIFKHEAISIFLITSIAAFTGAVIRNVYKVRQHDKDIKQLSEALEKEISEIKAAHEKDMKVIDCDIDEL